MANPKIASVILINLFQERREGALLADSERLADKIKE